MTVPAQSSNLFNLLPSIYRNRDADAGNILQNLFAILQDAHDAVDNDIAMLYENWFIETCAEWVVPYMGDLLGTPTLQTSNVAGGFTLRSYVAATLSYRKRKGTSIVVEQLARDITNWPALAVEEFQLLATTQYMQHLRPASIATVNMRDAAALASINGPFDSAARTADVRGIDDDSISDLADSGEPASATLLRGKPNLNNIAIFLWRIASYAIEGVTPRAMASTPDGRFRFHPAGIDMPLFSPGRALAQFTAPTSAMDVPSPLDRRTLSADLEALRQSIVDTGTGVSAFFGDTPVLQILLGGSPVPAQEISICDLSDIDASGDWRTLPTSLSYTRASDGALVAQKITACVDPVLGRFALTAGAPSQPVLTNYSYGFSGNIGGGPYDRTASVEAVMTGVDPNSQSSSFWQVAVSANKLLAQDVYPDLSSAVAVWNAQHQGSPQFGVIVLLDSETYTAPADPILLGDGSSLLIVGASWPSLNSTGNIVSYTLAAQNCRPHLVGDLHVSGSAPDGSDNPGTLLLNGLLHEGSIVVEAGNLGRMRLEHYTLIPPAASTATTGSIIIAASTGLENSSLSVEIESSIIGPITFPSGVTGAPSLTINQSIVDAGGAVAIQARAADATITGSTILGSIGSSSASGLRTLTASNVLFTGSVRVERVQSGCARYCSFTPDTIAVPRRFRCQPDLALTNITDAGEAEAIRTSLTPSFTSLTYGDPAYGQLSAGCAPELRAGADDGSEIGAFGFLKQPQRDANLRSVLPEYLRLSFRAGIFYVS